MDTPKKRTSTVPGKGWKKILTRGAIGLVVFIAVSFIAAGIVLVRGVSIQHLSLGPLSISECSLIWQDKLKVDVGTLVVSGNPQEEKAKTGGLRPTTITRAVKALSWFLGTVNIEDLKIGPWQGTVKVRQYDDALYAVTVQSDAFELQAYLGVKARSLSIDIQDLISKKFKSTIAGNINVDLENVVATGNLSTLINESFPVDLNFTADKEKLSFEGKEGGEIHSIAPLVDLFGLKHSIQRWITDYLSGSRYHLKSFKGSLPWNNPKEILNTLEAEVRVDDTEYTFAPGLEPIKGRYTDVYFTKGVLIIKPHEATFYGQDGGESWVDINFNDLKNILLTAYIKTRAVANDDILTLLNYYKIPLPFKQVGGKTATDLRLAITLNKKKIEADGIFEIDEGLIDWGGNIYKAENGYIKLVNSDVTIDQLKISYKSIFTASVAGLIQAKKKTGDLDIALEKLALKLGKSQLNVDASQPAQAKYHFDPGGHFLDAKPSSWLLDSLELKLGAFRAPVNLADFSVEIPPVQLGTPPGILTEVSGYYSIKKNQANFTCDLLKFHVKDLQLLNPHLAIAVDYDQGLIIKTAETAHWELNKMVVDLYPSEFKFGDGLFTVEQSRISYGHFFDSYLAGYFDIKEKKGRYSLNKIEITNKDLEERLKFDQNADVEVSGVGGKYVVSFPVFDLQISTDEQKNWSASFGNLSKVYSRSKILQKYKIKEGSLTLSSVNGKRPYKFSADIKAPYPLLVEGDTPTDALHITGRIADEGVFATINQDLELEYSDKNLRIKSKNLGYNISAIKQFLDDRSPPPQTDESPDKKTEHGKQFVLNVTADNSQIYISPKSRILADSINLEIVKGKVQVNLTHGPGKILLNWKKDKFMVDGSDLNDEFMGKLIQNSKFHGGMMSVSALGSPDSVSAIIEIKDTVLNKLAIVNNLMAFLNTVPALVTFSLPEYDRRGIPIDTAVVGLKLQNKVVKFESIKVVSPELEAKGKGEIDFTTKKIDMDIQLKTQAGKNVGKIPVVGYILAGKDEDESLTVKVDGQLDDPDVNYSVLKEVIVYPVGLLHRILKLPFNLVEKMGLHSEKANAPSGAAEVKIQSDGQSKED